jgi:hypothetical protein
MMSHRPILRISVALILVLPLIDTVLGSEGPFASDPFPVDGATVADTQVILSWIPGMGANLHAVYFGDNVEDVKSATRRIRQSNPSFTTGPLHPGKTYFWRVDEFDGTGIHKDEVWRFTIGRDNDDWTYDGGILVGAHYYPWYGPAAHRVAESLRGRLVPQQTAELGEYNSASDEVIARHIDYSHRANIHFWACSWWGPGTREDTAIKHRILTHPYAAELRYAILYESVGRCGPLSHPDYHADYGTLYLDILSEETAVLPMDPLSEALDTALIFTTGGSADWFRQDEESFEDGDGARSGDISHDEESWLQTTVSGAGILSFYWKVSSEGSFDTLEFYVDDSLRRRISGSIKWHETIHELTESGSHTLKWQYVKDASAASGDDCGWVDRVVWTPTP